MTVRPEREWSLRAPDPSIVRSVREGTDLSPTAAAILVNRGITDPGEAARFLDGTLRDATSPDRMMDLEKAAARLVTAGLRREPVLIYADYDVDGAAGAACLVLFLEKVFPGLPVAVHQNNRVADGYGLKAARLAEAAASGTKVVVTVDCGISDGDAIAVAAGRGLDVIVTDHHEPGAALPPGFAVVNPKRRDCPHPEKTLAGAGVAFLLACAVRRRLRDADGFRGDGALPDMRRYLDLVALGTVADMVPLRGDNRLFVRAGLEVLRARPRPGIRALASVAGVATETIDETDLAFRIGPRLNAAGRLGDSRRSADILATEDLAEASRIAAELNVENARRQREEERIAREAEAALLEEDDVSCGSAIVLGRPGWHPGVLGIVASRLAQKFHRPAVLLRVDPDEARGSCRSVAGFPLVEALAALSPLLSRYGGHHQAAGVALPTTNLAAFREGFGRLAAEYASRRRTPPCVEIDAQVDLADISHGLMEELERLRPFGIGNEEPVLLARNLAVTRESAFGGDGRHLKFEVVASGRRFEAVAFGRNGLPLPPGGRLDLLFTPQRSRFRGARSIRLLLRDARPAAGPAARHG
ncbi:MAG: single-stranded-DNA-specific exonuclease RecJ [Gemmatimonadota bacterium]